MAELKPCPFCGGKAEIWHGSARDEHICFDTISVLCFDCGARTREIWIDDENKYRAERDAIEAWNRRAEK